MRQSRFIHLLIFERERQIAVPDSYFFFHETLGEHERPYAFLLMFMNQLSEATAVKPPCLIVCVYMYIRAFQICLKIRPTSLVVPMKPPIIKSLPAQSVPL